MDNKGELMFNRTIIASIPIDTDIPIPKRKGKPKRGIRFPFDKMSVGDSFLISYGFMLEHDLTPRVTTDAVRYDGHRAGYAITTRMTDNGLRVWRIE